MWRWTSVSKSILLVGAVVALAYGQSHIEEADSVVVLLILVCCRLCLEISLVTTQLAIVRELECCVRDRQQDGAYGQGSLAVGRRERLLTQGWSLYQALELLILACFGMWVAELVVVVLVASKLDEVTDKSAYHSLLTGVVMEIASLVVRMFASVMPLTWYSLFRRQTEKTQLPIKLFWIMHQRARVTVLLRLLLLTCFCKPKYTCGKVASESTLAGVCEQDQISAAATTLALLLDYRVEGLAHYSALGRFAKLYYHTVSKEHNKPRRIQNLPMSPWQVQMLRKAVELKRYAIGVYTGWLLDVQRYSPCFCLCCWVATSVPVQGGSCGCSGKTSSSHVEGSIEGDNFFKAHRYRFKRYVGGKEVIIHSGQVHQGIANVAYCLVSRDAIFDRGGGNDREIILAIRGTEDICDIITDLFMVPIPLTRNDLSISEDHPDCSQDLGKAHMGALLCARSLVDNVGDKMEELLRAFQEQDASAKVSISVVGHSLGGAVASLVSLMLQARFPAQTRAQALVTAFAFQPLPVLDSVALTLSHKHHPRAIISFPYNDDIVSRLSLWRLFKLRNEILPQDPVERRSKQVSVFERAGLCAWAAKFACGMVCRCFTAGRRDVGNTELLGRARSVQWPTREDPSYSEEQEAAHESDILEQFDLESRASLLVSDGNGEVNVPLGAQVCDEGDIEKEEQERLNLFIPGQVVHVFRAANEYKAKLVNARTDLNDLVISKNMFVDHMPWRLCAGLGALSNAEFNRLLRLGSSTRKLLRFRPSEKKSKENKQPTMHQSNQHVFEMVQT